MLQQLKNKENVMETTSRAVAYYEALGKKDMEAVKKTLHPDVQYSDPDEKIVGRELLLKAAKGFTAIFKSLTIRAKFGSETQAMTLHDVEIPGLDKNLRTASLFSFQDGLISNIELIYDPRCLREKK